MTAGAMQPLWLGEPGRRLFAVHHPARRPAHRAVLVCPPLLFEQARSHRLLAQMADALAAAGCAVLRFDYLGTGDSEGEDAAFSPGQAQLDLACAAAALRERSRGLPQTVLAVRAAALLVAPRCAELDIRALWLWQPVLDGGGHVETLERIHQREARSPDRYLDPPAVATGESLVGFACQPGLRAQLAALAMPRLPDGLDLRELHARGQAPALADAQAVELPDPLSAWVGQLDMAGRTAPALFPPLVEQLLQPTAAAERRRHG
jgi:alpha-beta hydrolase superfamily lysophospholipase